MQRFDLATHWADEEPREDDAEHETDGQTGPRVVEEVPPRAAGVAVRALGGAGAEREPEQEQREPQGHPGRERDDREDEESQDQAHPEDFYPDT
jgi:hypothetical protein